MSKQSRRFPGLRCEKCGSDEFELEVSSDGDKWTVYLSCVDCPRVFSICRARSHNSVSAIPNENGKD
ncbi:MAG: hypothetical protein HDT42_10300 [Ruminococcaceae bacterium]|nr:hypothetical protein [Oscillospiraceae bacterium]